MGWIIGIVVLFGLAVALSWIIAGRNEKPLTSEIRKTEADGETAPLDPGDLFFKRRGPADGPVVVMIHGFGTPHMVFEQNAAALTAAGFHAILFDHFGRGWSDRPHALYDTEFYDKELSDLLDALDLKEPLALVGYSMGGVIAAEFANRHPERLTAIVLFAPAGLALEPFLGQTFGKVLRVPILGDWLWRLSARALLLGDPQFTKPPSDPTCCLQGDDTIQMRYRGYFQSLLQTWRHLPMEDRDAVFGSASEKVPMMAIFGDRDQTIGIESEARLKRAAPHARVEMIEGGTHGLLYEMHDTVNPLMIEFLRSNAR